MGKDYTYKQNMGKKVIFLPMFCYLIVTKGIKDFYCNLFASATIKLTRTTNFYFKILFESFN